MLIYYQQLQMKNQVYEHEKVLNTTVKKYFVCQQLGEGASAKVYSAINEQNNQQVALKIIPKAYLSSDPKLMELIKTQIYILKTCNNQNIVKCFDVFQTNMSIFIVMEYCNGFDMDKYVKKKVYLSEDHAVWYLKQMLNGFKGLHQIGAMHRDFKLPNLLLHDRVCKIADMGFAKQIKGQQLTSTVLGTEITMAPEVLQGKPYGTKADIWSLGVVFYQMLTGKYPYKGVSRIDLLKNIASKNNDYSQLRISNLAKAFIQGCLTYDFHDRISWIDIYNHPLLNKTSIQLIYGISNTSQVFFANLDFYRQSYIQDDKESSILLLRNSARKELIIQEINDASRKPTEKTELIRNSLQILQTPKKLVTYGVNYGVYLNQLIFPMKFFDLEKLSHIQIDFLTPIYLIYKKCVYEMRDLSYVIRKRINIFKIEVLWKEFQKSNIYNDLINITQNCLNRAQKLFSKIQKALENRKNLDMKLRNELYESNIKRKEFEQMLQHYVYKFAKDLEQLLLADEKSMDFIDICQTVVFYLDKDNKKINPQRFDWNQSKCVTYTINRSQLTNRLQSLLKQ